MPVDVEIYEFIKTAKGCKPDSACCQPSASTESEIMEAILKQEFGNTVMVKRIDLTTAEELPPAVEEALQEHGVTIEPLTVVNGKLVAKGTLPNLFEFMRIVNETM